MVLYRKTQTAVSSDMLRLLTRIHLKFVSLHLPMRLLTHRSAAADGITVKDTTLSFNVLTNAPSTNTTDHTFVPATGVTPTTVDYNQLLLETVTKVGHGLVAGDYIKVDQESIVFTYAQDSNVTNHAYPRLSDPIFNKSVKIERVTADTFEFNAYMKLTY